MPHIQIRNVPDDVHRELVRRAERSGQSLQQYLSAQLATLATTRSLDDVLDQVERSATGRLGIEDAVAALDAGRAGR